MVVKRIQLKDYRNYALADVTLKAGVNVLYGSNAQGKTNLLEAIYFCGVGRSPRTPRDRELIRAGQSYGRIKLTSEDVGGDNSVEIVLSKSENKRVAVNGYPILKLGELMGVVAAVYFSPDEMRIIKDAPGDRRRFMDVALCRMSKNYFYLLQRYNKILAQRNRLLKNGEGTDDVLDVWDAQLVASGARIALQRKGYLSRLLPYAVEAHGYLSGEKEELRLSYEGLAGETEEEIGAQFLAELRQNRDRDRKLCFTSCGVQKDDIAVSLGEVDVRTYGSQGQQRTAALSLKFAETELHTARKGEYPVLLLDDVLSELDPSRQQKLLERSSRYQTVLTCTHVPEALTQGCTLLRVEDGKVYKE